MQLKEIIPELQEQMYATMDHLDGLNKEELQERVNRKNDIFYVFSKVKDAADYYGEWQEVPVRKEELALLGTAPEDVADKILDRISKAKMEPRDDPALNSSDYEAVCEDLERMGIGEEIYRNEDFNTNNLFEIRSALEVYPDETRTCLKAFLEMQNMNYRRESDISKGVAMDTSANLQHHGLTYMLKKHPEFFADDSMFVPDMEGTWFGKFNQFVADRIYTECKNLVPICVHKGYEDLGDPIATLLEADPLTTDPQARYERIQQAAKENSKDEIFHLSEFISFKKQPAVVNRMVQAMRKLGMAAQQIEDVFTSAKMEAINRLQTLRRSDENEHGQGR